MTLLGPRDIISFPEWQLQCQPCSVKEHMSMRVHVTPYPVLRPTSSWCCEGAGKAGAATCRVSQTRLLSADYFTVLLAPILWRLYVGTVQAGQRKAEFIMVHEAIARDRQGLWELRR